MTLMRAALLTAAAVTFCGIAAAQLVPGGEPPPETPAPVPEVAPVAPPLPEAGTSTPVTAGMVSKVSLDDLKALFASANVPYEMAKLSNGRPYIVGKPSGWVMYVYVVDCDDNTVLAGCGGIILESATFVKKTTAVFVNDFNMKTANSHAVMVEGDQTYTKQVIGLFSGVSPTYLRDSFGWFVKEMVYYSDELEKSGVATPPAGGSFSTGTNLPENLQTAIRTGHAEDNGTSGHADGGAFEK